MQYVGKTFRSISGEVFTVINAVKGSKCYTYYLKFGEKTHMQSEDAFLRFVKLCTEV